MRFGGLNIAPNMDLEIALATRLLRSFFRIIEPNQLLWSQHGDRFIAAEPLHLVTGWH